MRVSTRLLGLAAATAGMALMLTGCSLLPAAAPQRDAESGEITQVQPNADVFQLRVGDCINSDELSEDGVTSVPVLPCANPHGDEVYFAFNMTGDVFPGQDVIDAEADATCTAEFTTFVGLDYESSVLDWWQFTPSEGSWGEGDREVLCLIYDPAGDVSGTLAGSAR